MLSGNRAHVGIYQVLDDVLLSTTVPPGVKGTLFSIIDELRGLSAPANDIRRAELVSLEIHKLEWGLQHSDEHITAEARDGLKSLAAAWLQSRIGALGA